MRLTDEMVQHYIKGLGEPVEVYEATGAGVVRSRLQAAAVVRVGKLFPQLPLPG